MPRKTESPAINIIKVPLKQKQVDIAPNFPKMPRMYLELMENKAKVKPELANVEYNPETKPQQSKKPQPPPVKQQSSTPEKLQDHEGPVTNIAKTGIVDKIMNLSENIKEPFSQTSSDNGDNSGDEGSDEGSDDFSDEISISDMSEDESGGSGESLKSEGSEGVVLRTDTEGVEDKLRRMLGPGDPIKQPDMFDDFQSTVSNKYKKAGDGGNKPPPPTLKELEQAGGYVPRKDMDDIGETTLTEQEEEDLKRELLFKFEMLKKKYPDSSVPEYSIHSSYKSMNSTYDMAVRRLSLDSSVDEYKTYLLLGFAGCEYLLGNIAGFDMAGFTKHQMTKMSGYQRLLIEIGEKSYTPGGSGWPVEVRLIFMIMINAAFFLITKMVVKKAGSALGNIFGNLNTESPPDTRPKRRMNGPDIDLDSIP